MHQFRSGNPHARRRRDRLYDLARELGIKAGYQLLVRDRLIVPAPLLAEDVAGGLVEADVWQHPPRLLGLLVPAPTWLLLLRHGDRMRRAYAAGFAQGQQRARARLFLEAFEAGSLDGRRLARIGPLPPARRDHAAAPGWPGWRR